MREIKFRALTQEGKIIKDVGKIEFFEDGAIIVNDEIPVERLIQYTGLKGKNGKEIFEGDVLSGDFPDVVFWDNDRGQWRLRNSENPDDNLWEIMRDNNPEIIGNVYENPELLES